MSSSRDEWRELGIKHVCLTLLDVEHVYFTLLPLLESHNNLLRSSDSRFAVIYKNTPINAARNIKSFVATKYARSLL
jgi:hypothetical protein